MPSGRCKERKCTINLVITLCGAFVVVFMSCCVIVPALKCTLYSVEPTHRAFSLGFKSTITNRSATCRERSSSAPSSIAPARHGSERHAASSINASTTVTSAWPSRWPCSGSASARCPPCAAACRGTRTVNCRSTNGRPPPPRRWSISSHGYGASGVLRCESNLNHSMRVCGGEGSFSASFLLLFWQNKEKS